MSKTFQQYTDHRLQHLVTGPAFHKRVQDAINKEKAKGSSLRKLPRLVLAASLLLGTLTAFALTQGFGLFQLMNPPAHPVTQKKAYDDLRTDLSFHRLAHVDVAVKEALYDGKYLRVAYTVTQRDAVAPLAPSITHLNDLPGFEFEAAIKDGVRYRTLDSALINGQEIQPLGASDAYTTDTKGQVIAWVQFDLGGVKLPDPFEVALPLIGQDTPETLRFSLSTKTSHNHQLPLPEPLRVGKQTLSVTEFLVSPLRLYATIKVTVDAGVPLADFLPQMQDWADKAALGDADWSQTYPIAGIGGHIKPENLVYEPVDPKASNPVFAFRIPDPTQPVTYTWQMEFLTPEQAPSTYRLGLTKQMSLLVENPHAE